MARTVLRGGRVYDPINGVDGELRDVWMQDGRIIAPPENPDVRAEIIVDVTGMIIMPGGVDMHCHIAGPKVNTARKMLPEQRRRARVMARTNLTRSGTLGTVPALLRPVICTQVSVTQPPLMPLSRRSARDTPMTSCRILRLLTRGSM
jgi:formylmethanofuran dehydrogenase subunit A